MNGIRIIFMIEEKKLRISCFNNRSEYNYKK